MNIKEIARLANVSTSTVSKIINKKDENISDETRRRVLQIVKDYHYTPYASIIKKAGQKSFLIALCLDAGQDHERLGSLIVERARESGYHVLVCRSHGPEEEYKNVAAVCSHSLDGIIWDRCEGSLERTWEAIGKKGVACRVMDSFSAGSKDNVCVDYGVLGYEAAQALASRGHTQVACLTRQKSCLEQAFYQGFQRAFLERGLPLSPNALCVLSSDEDLARHVLYEYTGAVCFSQELAARLYSLAFRKNRRIPKYFSVVSVLDGQPGWFQPELTGVEPPWDELARCLCYRLIADMEGRRAVEAAFHTRPRLRLGESVDIPLAMRKPRVVVVGSINIDTLISLETFPRMGASTYASSITTTPGGKGLNQAVGVSRLGAEAYLIGKVGKDYEGSEIFDYLQSSEVATEGIARTSKANTGHAYVHIQGDGESGIVLYSGANATLTANDITQNLAAFHGASFCLIQTEIGLEAVEYASRAAYNENVRIILKPSAVGQVSDEVIRRVFIFLPNEMEMERLCPSISTCEGRARHFLQKGAANVIITLGQRGCYWSDGARSRYFAAAPFRAVDTTGAADAFAAALAVCLTSRYDIETAIHCATVAAGYSTTKWGAPGAMIDRATLELAMGSEGKHPEITGQRASLLIDHHTSTDGMSKEEKP